MKFCKFILKGLILGFILINNISLANINKPQYNFSGLAQSKSYIYSSVKPLKKVIFNDNLKAGTVKEIILSEGQFVPNLNGNPNGYETIKVITTGNKELELLDYSNLRNSGIPIIDLSQAFSTSIPERAFKDATHLKEFKFPKGLVSIKGDYQNGAFYNCINLSGDLIIPNTVEYIGDYAFYNCNGLDGVLTIPNSVVTIGEASFSGCKNLKGDLIIPNSATSIGNSAFFGCSGFDGILELPTSLENIGSSAFSGCSSLSGNLVIPNSIDIINNNVFMGCKGFTGDLIIPNSVKNISISAFAECSGFDGKLVIPSSVKSIGSHAFWGCSGFVGNLILPNSLTKIDNYAFYGCSGFTGNLIIPNSVKSIDSHAFEGCSGFNDKLILPNSLVTIGDYVFKGCTGFRGRLIIPNNVSKIGDYAFYGCNGFSGDLIIPNSVTTIKSRAFEGCTGFNGILVLSNNLNTIGSNAFRNCGNFKGDLLIPNSVKEMGENVFENSTGFRKIVFKVDSSDENTNYRENISNSLPDTKQTVIDLPYDFHTSNTWISNTNKTVGKPIIKNIVNGLESEIVNENESVSLYIPSVYSRKNITVLKDGESYKPPFKNSENKHVFLKSGVYQVTIVTNLGNTSVITFEIIDDRFKNAEEAVEKAEISKDINDIEIARDLVNQLPESIEKDGLEQRLDYLFPNIEIDKKTTSSYLDIYVESENMISMSINTNSVVFDGFSGVEDEEKLNVMNITVNSSLPYELNAYLVGEIQNSDKTNIFNKEILNIKENSDEKYKTFNGTNNKLILKNNIDAGHYINHSVDLMLKGDIAHNSDIYKAIIKFEIQQK